MNIQQLNERYGIDGKLTIQAGEGGLPMIHINHEGVSALISIYAGQVLSFTPRNAKEDVLFLSHKAYYQEGKAIKGGVPVCWPWFGPDPEGMGRAAHGFARNTTWRVLDTNILTNGEIVVKLGLKDNQDTRKIWPFPFDLLQTIIIGDSLTIELTTHNRGGQVFTITQALHTYFRVGDITKVHVQGLDQHDYLDKVDNGKKKTQQGDIVIAGEVDRIYLDVGEELTIVDDALGRKISIHSSGNNTAVVWNPWSEICAGMADLEDSDYRHFVCVETTNAASDTIEIFPGDDYTLRASYQIES